MKEYQPYYRAFKQLLNKVGKSLLNVLFEIETSIFEPLPTEFSAIGKREVDFLAKVQWENKATLVQLDIQSSND